MIRAEDLVGEEWAEWYRLTPQERFRESEKMWETFIALAGSLDPEPDTQSPFFDAEEWRANAAHGWPGVRVLRGAEFSRDLDLLVIVRTG
jgi:hypothetical protein